MTKNLEADQKSPTARDRSDPISADKRVTGNWCQGFCRLCGTGCGEYCEEIASLRAQIASLDVALKGESEEVARLTDAALQKQALLDDWQKTWDEFTPLNAAKNARLFAFEDALKAIAAKGEASPGDKKAAMAKAALDAASGTPDAR
jgi:hypothetical protein